ncbi:MAG: hypothetical protein QW714_02450 [Nanopusillaceae archaeon]
MDKKYDLQKKIFNILIFLSIVVIVICFLSSVYGQGSLTCDVEMCVNISSPSGRYFTNWLAMSFSSQTGTTRYYTYNLGYTFCPEEGTYSATFIYTLTGAQATVSLYSVNYDLSRDWCVCYGNYYSKAVAWNISGEYTNPYCCGDDPNEFILSCSPAGQEPCTLSTINTACCNSQSKCVYNGQCYSPGSSITVNGITYTCSNNIWSNCIPPSTGDWIVNSVCVINQNYTVNGNLILQSNGYLVIDGVQLRVTGTIIFLGGRLELRNRGSIIRG